ncbi:hypothetical protein IP91_04652 [Pseudoduganella lurida]|uniref:Uncharacterized protein n=1 Tax=Pseudoduganella lurida TaxID=1036180 RepID=A0A562QXK4_9BURK|nr:hypothetical protein [Pseudoduganella lurida]TWI61571.1 hypothetical protein IP91_04652 [Pseudoduganella lurida]
MNSKALGTTAFADSHVVMSSDGNTGHRGLLARLSDAMGLTALLQLPADSTAAATGAPAPLVLEEKFFAKEAEAEAYAALLVSHGYRTTVAQSAYDYIWSVEVYAADDDAPGN